VVRVPFVLGTANLSRKVVVSMAGMIGAHLRRLVSVSVNLVAQEIVPSADVSLIMILVANLALKVEVGLVEKVGQDVGVGLTDKVVGNVVAARVDSNAHVIAGAGTVIGSTAIGHLGKLIDLPRNGNRTSVDDQAVRGNLPSGGEAEVEKKAKLRGPAPPAPGTIFRFVRFFRVTGVGARAGKPGRRGPFDRIIRLFPRPWLDQGCFLIERAKEQVDWQPSAGLRCQRSTASQDRDRPHNRGRLAYKAD